MKTDAFSKCHPAVNFIFYLGAIGFGVVIRHPAYIAAGLLCAGLYGCILLPRRGWKLCLGLLPMLLFVAVINPLFNQEGERVLFYLLGKPYTLEALAYGAATGGIFGVSVLWFYSFGAVLTSDKLLSLFASRIPALSLLLTMILRLIPDLGRKAGQIITARRSIGMGAGAHESKRRRIRSGMDVLSALTDRALEGGILTADSMAARGYGAARRTGFQLYRFTSRDGVLLGAMLLLMTAAVIFGGMDASYTPAFSIPPVNPGLGAYSLFLLIPVILDGKEALAWHISRSKI